VDLDLVLERWQVLRVDGFEKARSLVLDHDFFELLDFRCVRRLMANQLDNGEFLL